MYTTPPTAALVATCALRRATDTNRPRTADSLPAPNTLSTFLRELLVGDAHKPSVSPYAAHRQTSDAHRISLDTSWISAGISAGSNPIIFKTHVGHPCKWHRVAPGG